MKQFITYAQNNEDVILDAYFNDIKKGTYVDVGANHPINDSVTKHFYEKGWRGLNIEPVKRLHTLLVADRPKDINLNIGISDKPGTLVLREYANSGLSTFSDELKQRYGKKSHHKTDTFSDMPVQVVTLASLLTEHGVKHIHFMKIDTEGSEYEVLAGNDWKKFRPEMLCIEANHLMEGKDWRLILDRNNYEKVWNDGLNDYYLAKESAKRKSNFKYAETMVLETQVLPHHVMTRINELQQQLHDERIKLEVQAIKVKRLERDNQAAEKKIVEQKRIKNATKLVVKAVDNVISARIEHLRIANQRSNLSGKSKAAGEFDASNQDTLLASIRNNDMSLYYSTKKPRPEQKFYAYKIINGSYVFAKRAVRKSLRTAFGIVKKDIHDQK